MSLPWIQVVSCLAVSASLMAATPAPRAAKAPPAPVRNQPEKKEPVKAKPAEPTKRELTDQNVRFETPAEWHDAGSAAGCHGGFVLALNLPVKPVKVDVKPGGKMLPVPAAGYASMFTFVVNPDAVDASNLDAAVESMQAQIKKTYDDATFTPAKDVKIGGESAKQFVATFKEPVDDGPAIPKRQTILLTRRADKTYRFALEASAPNYDKDRPALDKLLHTVAWLDADNTKAGASSPATKPTASAEKKQQQPSPDAGA